MQCVYQHTVLMINDKLIGQIINKRIEIIISSAQAIYIKQKLYWTYAYVYYIWDSIITKRYTYKNNCTTSINHNAIIYTYIVVYIVYNTYCKYLCHFGLHFFFWHSMHIVTEDWARSPVIFRKTTIKIKESAVVSDFAIGVQF